jgi:AcrR family transcriptional regulator
MPTRKRKRATGGGREEILSAAKREFAAKGFAAASTAGIARLAKVTQPLVHHHFKSKRALWLAVADELFAPLHEALRSGLAECAAQPVGARLEHLVRTLVRHVGTHPATARLTRLETMSGGEAYGLLYERWLAPMVKFLQDELTEGVRVGVVRPIDTRLAVLLIAGAVGQPFAEPRVARHAFQLDMLAPAMVEAYGEFIVQTLLQGLLTPRAGDA